MTDLGECERLQRRLQRERARREAAELIGEEVTADLYATVSELRRVQAELFEQSDRQRVVGDLARRLGQAHDTETLLRSAAAEIGRLLGVDRCQVHLTDPADSPAFGDWWAAEGMPAPVPLTRLPAPLAALLEADVPPHEAVQVPDLAADPRLAGTGPTVVTALGGRAFAAIPVRVGVLRVGWLLLIDLTPGSWTERTIAIGDAVGQELGTGILRLQAAEQQESVRRLEELDHAKDALISNVSHELRTPLTSIRGYVELLEAGDLGSLGGPATGALQVIGRNAERLSRLVENLLRLSAQDEQVALDLAEVDVGELTVACRRALRPMIEDAAVELSVSVPPDLRPIRADREQLEQVVLNLLGNAVKFTEPAGRVSVTVEDTAHGVALAVVDTGIGIPARELSGVFSRFFRSSLSVAREIQGTGLGLALSKSIVEVHGGRLSLTSIEGVGTTVRVELPALDAG